MPNLTFDTLELVPEGLKEHAKNTDGKFVVNVVPEAKLTEFRDNNVTLSRQRDDLAGILGKLKPVVGDDVDAFVTSFGELKTMAQQVKDGKLKTSDAIEAEVLNRVGTMKSGFETQNAEANARAAASEARAAAADQKLNRSIVERHVTDAVVNEKSGANPGALPDILSRAERVFQVVDGRLVAKDGEAIIYGADGATPMTPMEWMTKLREQAPYLFKGSNGGGAGGGSEGGGYKGTGLTQEAYNKLPSLRKLELGQRKKA